MATDDIGRIAAEILLQTWSVNRYIEVAGPRLYTPNEIASAFATVLKQDVKAVAVPRDTWISNFVAQGTPEDRTAPRVEMLEAFNSGWIDFGVPGTEHIHGTIGLEKVIAQLVAKTGKQ